MPDPKDEAHPNCGADTGDRTEKCRRQFERTRCNVKRKTASRDKPAHDNCQRPPLLEPCFCLGQRFIGHETPRPARGCGAPSESQTQGVKAHVPNPDAEKSAGE